MNHLNRLLLIALALGLAACGGDDSSGTPNAATQAKATGPLLAADIEGTVDIKAALELEPGSDVAVVGRVQEISPGGMALFYLVDDSIAYCGRGSEECGCETPWDYCCEEAAMRAARMAIELRDESGKIVKADDLGLRLLDLVAVKGKLHKTEEGGLYLVADDGWYRRERPKLPEGLAWPQ